MRGMYTEEEGKNKSGRWRYLWMITLFLLCSTLVSCKQKSEQEIETLKVEEDITGEDSSKNHVTIDAPETITEDISVDTVSNNGGTVLFTGATTYFYAPNNNIENSEYQWAIYAMKENGSEKRKLVKTHSRENFYLIDDAIYVSDYKESGSVIMKISLDTGVTESLCKGTLECINIQRKELLFTADNYDLPMEEEGIYKMSLDNGEIIRLCSDDYQFIEEVNGIVYLEAPHADNSNDAVLASINSDGTDLKTIATIPAVIYGGESTAEYIVDFGLCDDWIILSVGNYQGTGLFFYGGLVRMKEDGQQLERFCPRQIDYFTIMEEWIYFNDRNAAVSDLGKDGYYRIRPDLSEEEFLGEEIRYSCSEDGNIFYCYDPINDSAEYRINDLQLCSYDEQNTVTLFHEKTAPRYEDSAYIRYENVELVGDYIYFNVNVEGYAPSDNWRGQSYYNAYFRVHKDGIGLELLYEDDTVKCNTKDESISFVEYYNDRFAFSIEYPSTFVTKMLTVNGDGIILESPDRNAKLTVSGVNNVLDSTVESYFDDFIINPEDIIYKELKDNWFVISWMEEDKILYRKSVVGPGSINTFTFQYPLVEKEYYDQVVNKLMESFKTPGILESHTMDLNEKIYDYEKVCDLFINRFLITSSDKNDITYALKSDPSDFAYKVFVDRFDDVRGMYEIRLNRSSDTAQNYFYYDPMTEKFYKNGANLEEITSDYIFFGSLFS